MEGGHCPKAREWGLKEDCISSSVRLVVGVDQEVSSTANFQQSLEDARSEPRSRCYHSRSPPGVPYLFEAMQ